MPREEYTLDLSDRERILLGKRLSLKETTEVLDLLRSVKGLTFDFHKLLRIEGNKKDKLYGEIQELLGRFASENSAIPRETIGHVNPFFARRSSGSEDYFPLDVVYSFGDVSAEKIVQSGFNSGYVRIKDSTAAIVSFNGGLGGIISNPREYKCHLNNISKGMDLQGEQETQIEPAKKHQSKLFNLLEGKLLKPTFIDLAD